MNKNIRRTKSQIGPDNFNNFKIGTWTSIYVYILETIGCLNFCKTKIGIQKLKDIKMKLEKADEYLDHDFNIRELVVFMKENKANILLN